MVVAVCMGPYAVALHVGCNTFAGFEIWNASVLVCIMLICQISKYGGTRSASHCFLPSALCEQNLLTTHAAISLTKAYIIMHVWSRRFGECDGCVSARPLFHML